MIIASSIEKSYGPQILFEDVSFLINKGERIGLVGKNGTGKSTLFRMILGQENYDSGTLSIPRSEEHTSELQSRTNLVCRLLLEKKKDR